MASPAAHPVLLLAPTHLPLVSPTPYPAGVPLKTATLVPAPGASSVVDPMAVGHAKRGAIDLVVLDGRDLARLDAALEGKAFDGTLIRSNR